MTIHRSEFIRLLRAELPEIEPLLRGSRLNLTSEMSAFLELAEMAIASGDRDQVGRIFSFAERVLTQGNFEVRNALGVSFLEHLPLDSAAGREVLSILPSSLRLAREEALVSLGKRGAS